MTAVLALMIGIGANSAIFSVVNATLLRPLPYEASDQLMILNETAGLDSSDRYGVSYPNFVEWQNQNQSFEQVAAIRYSNVTLTGGDEPSRVPIALVSSNLFDLLRVKPALGRSFLPDEDKPGASTVVVMSHRLWARGFGSDPEIIGKTITLNGRAYPVIAVMPRDFEFPNETVGLWLALGPLADQMTNRTVHFLSVVGRLKPGLSTEQARSDLQAVAARIQEQYPGTDPGHGIRVVPMRDEIVGDVRPALFVLLSAVLFVLLIACANVANLLLARAASRQKEIAIRTALGASRWRVMRQLLTESMLLALVGGGLGLLLALWGVDLLVANVPDYLPRVKEIGIDRYVLGFTFAVSFVTGLVFGFAPAFQASNPDLNETLKEGKSTASRTRHLTRSVMVIAEVALSLVLLIGAGLMIKSFRQLTNVNPGFQPENLLTMTVSLAGPRYTDNEPVISFYQQMRERLEAIPGVQSASATSTLPISGGDSNGELAIEGRPFAPGEAPGASFRRVLPNYFQTMSIPLLEGRPFDERDRGGHSMVIIVNQEMARRYWPNGDALGKRIKIGPPEREPWLTIVAVAGDVKNTGLDAEPKLATYEPHAQRPRGTMDILIRTSVSPMSLADAVRSEIRAADKDAPVYSVGTMEKRIQASVAPRRFNMALLTIFALMALVLAAIGVYGVMSYTVAERTREIGIRMALGAQSSDVLKMVVKQGLMLATAGIVSGLVASLFLTRLMTSLLFGVSATDPATFALISTLLIGMALLACAVPAHRATKIDPMVALRYE